ncbi:MAG TPA: adenylate/guanylate cyclase domain-containing protein, partial [Chloroflexi bacterium]|nr:adenylate/guanylate cyclase domain-containing protein [Chloroflexota bacterium]
MPAPVLAAACSFWMIWASLTRWKKPSPYAPPPCTNCIAAMTTGPNRCGGSPSSSSAAWGWTKKRCRQRIWWPGKMSSRQQYQQAIAALQSQRDLLGDAVVDTTIAVLQERLEGGDGRTPDARVAQRKQVTILFANVAGFTGIVESLPDTNMLDIMNVLWRQLDQAITGHNGSIDKHVGDAVMGLFGVPVAHEDDPEQAVRAALAMRVVLSDF